MSNVEWTMLTNYPDVFLTTMKPQRKVVTAQDVQSSLYYLHVATPNDYRLLQDPNSDEESVGELPNIHPASNDKASVSRKPLPPNPNSDLCNRQNLPRAENLRMQAQSGGSNESAQVPIKHLNRGIRPGLGTLDSAPVLPPRKLLGPRSMNQNRLSVDNMALQNVPQRQNLDMRRWSEQPAGRLPRSPPRPIPNDDKRSHVPLKGDRDHLAMNDTMNGRSNPNNSKRSANHCWEWEKSWETRLASEARAEMAEVASAWRSSQETLEDMTFRSRHASLLLIRRYNGAQWNVAKLNDTGQGHVVESNPNSCAGTMIEILTPGYSKLMEAKDANGGQTFPAAPRQDAVLAGVENANFRRHLLHSKDVRRPRNPLMAGSSEAGFATEQTRPTLERGRQSSDSFGASNTEQIMHTPASSRGYVIESPWEGVCEFSAGVAGRSFKCKHTYISKDPEFRPGRFSAPVSELRFDLPSSKALGTPTKKGTGSGALQSGKRSSLFLRSHHRQTSSLEIDGANGNQTFGAKFEPEDRLDLSLGQEHAGGGFGGKQAKLGKLIVEVEGLQMLDLVVAANMALWWKVYEKTT